MALEFKLEKFEGPLDLLLHLIDKDKIDIYDIPIAEITDQYIEYVNAMQEDEDADMDVMSEFLVMAATLLDIKCRMLLPKEVNEEGVEEDPRDELVQKLLEYKMYKYMAAQLREREGAAGQSVYRGKRVPKEVQSYVPPVNYEELLQDTTLTTLRDIFDEILRRQKYRVDPVRSTFGTIEKEAVDIGQKQLFIKAWLNRNRKASFRQLMETQETRDEVIVSFLVLLELMKTGKLRVTQEETFSDIIIETLEELRTDDEGEFDADFA